MTSLERQVLKLLPLPRNKVIKALTKDGMRKKEADVLVDTMLWGGLLVPINGNLTPAKGVKP